MTPRVSFVNVGPGDPRLRSGLAAQRLAAADAVVGDDEVAPDALVALAQRGMRVVRTFGVAGFGGARVAAEALALARAGVAIEVVPGIEAAAAVAAYAGVLGPAVVTTPAEVAGALGGAAASDPVTLVADAGLPSQRVVVTTAGEAPAKASEMAATHVVVASGAPLAALRWFERLPLFGKRVLVTRRLEQAGQTAELLRDLGADAWVVPAIELRPPADREPLVRAIEALRAGAYDWVMFTSANGVERTWDALVAAGGDARAFGRAGLAAIGPATALALESRGLRADVVAQEFRGEGLAAAWLEAVADRPGAAREGARVLVSRAAKARDVLPDMLRAAGHSVDVVAAYETHATSADTARAVAVELAAGRVDAVTFTSSSTVENLCDMLGAGAAGLLAKTRVASIGPITTAAALARGVRVDVTAGAYTVAALVDALAASYR